MSETTSAHQQGGSACGCDGECCDATTTVAAVRTSTGCCGDECCGESTTGARESTEPALVAAARGSRLPIAIIGAGPVGLAAAAQVLARGETPLVLEAGAVVGASIRKWGHVRLFSPWRYAVDPASERLLAA